MYSIKPIVEEIHNIYEQGKAEGRAEAIDELIKHFEEHHILVFEKNEIIDELEQLREKKNDC